MNDSNLVRGELVSMSPEAGRCLVELPRQVLQRSAAVFQNLLWPQKFPINRELGHCTLVTFSHNLRKSLRKLEAHEDQEQEFLCDRVVRLNGLTLQQHRHTLRIGFHGRESFAATVPSTR